MDNSTREAARLILLYIIIPLLQHNNVTVIRLLYIYVCYCAI